MGDEQMEHEPPTINLNTISSEWTTLLPQILNKRHLKCIHQTPTSAKHLFPNGNYYSYYGYTASTSYHQNLNNPKTDTVDVEVDGEKNFIPHELESTLFEAFFDNDYDGALHLTTIHEVDDDADSSDPLSCENTSSTNTNSHYHLDHDQGTNLQYHNIRNMSTPVGIIFWREMPDEEMVEWLDFDNLIKALHRHANTLSLHENDITSQDHHHHDYDECNPKAIRSLRMVRQNSIHSLTNITSDTNATSSLNDLEEAIAYAITTTENKSNNSRIIDDSLIQKDVVAHAWVKIELLSVRKRGQKIGTLLLACALYHAYLHTNQHQSRAILHVAGGSSNVPAVKLYKRFGFLPVPIKSGIFHTPNKDLYILGNIGQSLAALAWEETL